MFGATMRLGGGANLNQLTSMHSKHRRSTLLKNVPIPIAPPTTGVEGAGGVRKPRKSAAAADSSFPSRNEAALDELTTTQETLVAAELPAMDLDAEQEKPLRRPKALASVKKTSPKLKIKKSLDRRTFLAVCRAVAFGVTLIGLGVVMAVLGFYRDYFAQEPGPVIYDVDKNATLVSTVINRSTKAQVESLSYIGPCIMGCGMFILMMACVMTLEGRDRNTHLFTQRIINRRRQIMRQNREMEQNEKAQSKIHLMNNENVDRVPRKRPEERADEDSKGNFNRAFKDDHTLKSSTSAANKIAQSATDVQLTLSNNSGVDSCSIKAIHTPATGQLSSASTGAVVADRQLLQRFLDEQSQMDDYRRILAQARTPAVDAPRLWSPNEQCRTPPPPAGAGVLVAAQIHEYHERPPPQQAKRAPLAAPETLSTCSGVVASGIQSAIDGSSSVAADRNNSPPSPFRLFSPHRPTKFDFRRNSSQNSVGSFVTVQSQISSSTNNNYHNTNRNNNHFSNNNMTANVENSTILPRQPKSPNPLTIQR